MLTVLLNSSLKVLVQLQNVFIAIQVSSFLDKISTFYKLLFLLKLAVMREERWNMMDET